MFTGYGRKLEPIPPPDTFFADNLGPILIRMAVTMKSIIKDDLGFRQRMA